MENFNWHLFGNINEVTTMFLLITTKYLSEQYEGVILPIPDIILLSSKKYWTEAMWVPEKLDSIFFISTVIEQFGRVLALTTKQPCDGFENFYLPIFQLKTSNKIILQEELEIRIVLRFDKDLYLKAGDKQGKTFVMFLTESSIRWVQRSVIDEYAALSLSANETTPPKIPNWAFIDFYKMRPLICACGRLCEAHSNSFQPSQGSSESIVSLQEKVTSKDGEGIKAKRKRRRRRAKKAHEAQDLQL